MCLVRQNQYQSKVPRGRTVDEPVTGSSAAQWCTWGRMASLDVLIQWLTRPLRCKCGPAAGTRGSPDGCGLSHHAHSPWHEDKSIQEGLRVWNNIYLQVRGLLQQKGAEINIRQAKVLADGKGGWVPLHRKCQEAGGDANTMVAADVGVW